jgi:acyl transferase domain-containing protein/acyl carrier protein
MSAEGKDNRLEGVAVIGLACRFPGAPDAETFWRNLCDGVESVKQFTDEELLAAGVERSVIDDPNYIKARPQLDNIDLFDAGFFGFTPREAEIMDPQQRLFLESVWEALENAGYDSEQFPGRISLYAGSNISTYLLNNLLTRPELRGRGDHQHILLGNDKDYLTTRVSMKLNLKGPSVAVQTACSTSLVAVHLACQSLLDYEADMAVAGGVSIDVPQEGGYYYQEGGILSPDGHCRTFDAEARGTLFGSGVGVVVLKRLSEAVADGDRVRAVIRGSAINNDGSEKVGYTAPSVRGQAEVIAEALALGGVEPGTVGYVEAHGTATELGDPIEVEALTQVFGAGGGRQFCAIGSVKSNFGHLNKAAGIAGLIKAVLAVEEGRIPPSLHFRSPNPKIDFASSPFFVCDRLSAWPALGGLRRAGVSSFGIGGTNAHVVIEQAPAAPEPSPAGRHQLLTLSARTPSALEAATDSLADALERIGGSRGAEAAPADAALADAALADAALADAAYTLGAGRRHFAHRRCVVASTAAEASRLLRSREARRVRTRFSESKSPAVVFLFPGQGAQYVNMGRSLYEAGARGGESSEFGEFRGWLDRCCELLLPELGLDLRGVLYPEAGGEAEAAGLLRQTRLTQPALFAVEYALARQLIAWGVRPWAMVGHSVGEWVAACLAGVFTPEAALRLVAERGRLMQAQPAGAMLAVPLGEAELGELAAECGVWVAAVNAPGRCVAAGAEAGLALLEARLGGMGLGGRRLETSHAFHSGLMEGAVGSLVEAVRRAGEAGEPRLPFASNVTGRWVTAEEARDPGYWGRQMLSCVRFGAGLEEALAGGERVVVEVGPGRGLSGLARRAGAAAGSEPAAYAAMRGEGEEVEDEAVLLEAVGGAWLGGAGVEWGRVFGGGRRRVPLPTYPFERRRYWVEAGKEGAGAPGGAGAKGKGGAGRPEVADWFDLPSWKRALAPEAEAGAVSGRWLVFGRGGGRLTAAVLSELGRLGGEAVLVESGAGAARTGAGYAVRAGEREDYEWLGGEAFGGGEGLGVIHLWGAEEPGGEGGAGSEAAADAGWRRAQEEGFYSLLALAQALGRANFTSPVRLAAVAVGVESVAGEPARRPEWATVTGPCKVMAQEYPNVRCERLDVEWEDGGEGEAEGLARRIVAEAAACEESEVALRGRGRWVRHYEPVRLGGGDESWARRGGVYMITGGTGGIGLALAGWLAREQGARLLLVSRSGMSGPGMAERVRELEEAGAEVLVTAADVRDEGALRGAVREAVRRWGGIDGVIHAAGVAGGGMMQGKSRAAAAEVLGAKAEGLRVVERVVGEECVGGVGWVAACSSLAAVRGGLGQSDYCGANAYLDAWARGEGGALGGARRVSINWGAWAEVGMAVDAVAKRGYLPCPFWLEASQKQIVKKEISHPLLDQCVRETETEKAYLSDLSPSRLWVLSEHKIMGNATLPGTAYLELVRAAFEEHTKAERAEIREMYFLSPLMVPADEKKEVHVMFKREEAGGYSFRVTSRHEAGGDEESKLQEHARGKISVPTNGASHEYDLAGLIGSLRELEVKPAAPETPEARFVEVGPRWNCLKSTYAGDGEGVALLELPEEFAADLQHYKIHPAMLDMAVGIAKKLAGGEGNYLPLSYKRFEMFRPFTRRIYSHLRCRERREEANAGAVLTFDVTLFDEAGELLVEIEEYTLRRVHDIASQLKSLGSEEFGKVVANDQMLAGAILSDEGVEAFRLLMAHGDLTQVIVSPLDVPSIIAKWSPKGSNLVEEIGKAQLLKPAHARPDTGVEYVGPRNEIEVMVAEIWEKMLGIDRIGVQDDFFVLGGDSLLGIQVVSRLREIFPIEMSPAMLFECPTIAQISATVAELLAESVGGDLLNELDAVDAAGD